jgi:hypothetical protein
MRPMSVPRPMHATTPLSCPEVCTLSQETRNNTKDINVSENEILVEQGSVHVCVCMCARVHVCVCVCVCVCVLQNGKAFHRQSCNLFHLKCGHQHFSCWWPRGGNSHPVYKGATWRCSLVMPGMKFRLSLNICWEGNRKTNSAVILQAILWST